MGNVRDTHRKPGAHLGAWMGISALVVLVFLMVVGALGSLFELRLGILGKGFKRISVAKEGYVGDAHQALPTGAREQKHKIAEDKCATHLQEAEGFAERATHHMTKTLESYANTWPSMDGWMDGIHAALVFACTKSQKENGISGSIGEIGLHHGKFFLNLLSNKASEERAIGIDLFESQFLNFDGSGRGRQQAVHKNAELLGFQRTQYQLLSTDSTTLGVQHFESMNISAFRLFSVDGGHAFDTTLHDLKLAQCSLMEGGVIIVDDFIHAKWLGVADAVFYFLHNQRTVRPFLWLCNKLYLTSISNHAKMLQLVLAMPCISCSSAERMHSSRYTLAHFQLCVGFGNCGMSVWESMEKCFPNQTLNA